MTRLIRELEPFSTLRGMQAELSASESVFALDEHERAAAGVEVGPAPSVVPKPARSSVASAASFGAVFRQGLQTLASPRSRKAWLAAAVLALALPALLYLRPGRQASHETEPPPSRAAQVVPAPSPSVPSNLVPPDPAPVSTPVPEDQDAEIAEVLQRRRDARVPRMRTDARVSDVAREPVAVSPAAMRNEATIRRLQEQLVQCDERKTPAMRVQCQNDHKREIAEHEEQRELLAPLSDR
jgi:hypothetical protein